MNVLLQLHDADDNYIKAIQNIVNKQDKTGETPLHCAVNSWPQDVVKSLLSLGADVGITNNNQEIPLAQISVDSLTSFLDEHCMSATGFDADDADAEYKAFGNNTDEENKDYKDFNKVYKDLYAHYDPNFMTNISQKKLKLLFDMDF